MITRQEYDAACEKHSEAYEVFRPIQEAWRAKQISPAEYWEARKVRNLADDEFEKAWELAIQAGI